MRGFPEIPIMKENISGNYTLILITSKFPFGPGESFLANELPYLSDSFKRIIIVSRETKNNRYYNVPDSIKTYRYNDTTTLTGILALPLLLIRNAAMISRLIQDEITYRSNSGFRFKNQHRRLLVRKIIKALQLRNFIEGVIKAEQPGNNLLLYSYWLNTGAHAIATLKCSNAVKIARGHNSDIYEDKSPSRFLPLLNFCTKKLDKLFLISDDGREYFKNRFPDSEDKLIVSKLGVEINLSPSQQTTEPGKFTIVTCSNLIPLKRIDLVIDALAKVNTDAHIMWFHFGDGPLRQDLEEKASALFEKKSKISWQFMGQIKNENLLKFYHDNHIDLFINSSTTEGLPVSIMEAQSFGIPVIATDVGGVREIVKNGTGILVSSNVSALELATAIENYISIDNIQKDNFRNNSLRNARDCFDSRKNYMDFISQVNSILATNGLKEENTNEN